MFVKICGTTSEADALLSVALGADSVGFIFAPSARQVAPGLVADIVKRLPPEVMTVGVFRDEAASRVVDIVNRTGLKGAQLHGHESPTESKWVAERVRFLIKAFPVGHPGLKDPSGYGATAILVDNPTPGSGQVFDWRLIEGAGVTPRLILAGGLDVNNVGDAIAQAHPWGVDVVTGVEASPGVKDPRKLRAFIANARAAAAPDYEGGDELPYDWQFEG